MKIKALGIPDVLLLTPDVYSDDRGFFMEKYNQQQFNDATREEIKFVQDNHSYSHKNTLRGLHYQIHKPQGKLVSVVTGAVFDVAVDMRKSSPHFGMWVGVVISDVNNQMLWIPPGFAHGFYVLSKTANFMYKTTDYYDSESDCCIRWDDPTIDIDWPITKGSYPLLSDKDANGLFFQHAPSYN
jgi:dTDP-4-dehydrorhamnose 3,5-epimerase